MLSFYDIKAYFLRYINCMMTVHTGSQQPPIAIVPLQGSQLDFSNGFSSDNAYSSDGIYNDFANNPTPTRMQLARYQTHAYDNPSFAVPALDPAPEHFFKMPLSQSAWRLFFLLLTLALV